MTKTDNDKIFPFCLYFCICLNFTLSNEPIVTNIITPYIKLSTIIL